MADTAAHLVDRVLPVAPVRQWVLTLPWPLRYRMAYDATLTSDLLRVFTRALFASLRRRADRPARGLRCGAVTFVQRFGDALNLNVHFHTLALDGVYERGDEGVERFHALPPPDDAEVARVATRIARGVARLLRRRGLQMDGDPNDVDPLADAEPLLAALAATSIRGRIATGRRAGQRVLHFGDGIEYPTGSSPTNPARSAVVAGFSIHANVAAPAHDRKRLEHLCRYVARPPVATDRLERLPDGRLLYRLKRRWNDGTIAVVFEPLELIEKLAALVPPPRFNTVRYHGVLAPAASRRSRIVPSSDLRETQEAVCACRTRPATDHAAERLPPIPASMPGDPTNASNRGAARQPGRTRLRYYSWPELMQRVFAVDVLECPECGGAMRILAAIHPPDATRAILDCLGLPTRAPPQKPAESGLDPPAGAPNDFDADPDPYETHII